jgi:hypothetical protein
MITNQALVNTIVNEVATHDILSLAKAVPILIVPMVNSTPGKIKAYYDRSKPSS